MDGYMGAKPLMLTQAYLRSILHYCPESGVFTWVAPPKQHPRMKGKAAGSPASGYLMIRVNGCKYKAHRLAWLYVYGVQPVHVIDHRDGNQFNNAIANLREASMAQNGANARRKAGKELPKGVRKNGSGYTARISFQGQLRTIGTFPTIEDASSAYITEARRLYGDFARAA